MPVQRLSRSLLVRARTVLLASAISVLTLGCAHAASKTELPVASEDNPELAQLRRENSALRNRVQNLEERVRMLERGEQVAVGSAGDGYQRYGSLDSAPEAEWDEPDHDGRRQLPVVKLTPAGKSIERRESTPAPQPTSVSRGRSSVSLSAVPHSGGPDGYDDYDNYVDARGYDDDPPDAHADASGAPASYRLVGSKLVQATQRKPATATNRDRSSGVIKDYEAAMALYRDGRYADAEKAFSAIVSAHPNHEYADNALYWQGEAAYDQAHYADALAAFTKVVERYGGGNKAPDALLKIGLCYGRLGDAANARDVLTQLIAAYPSANASKIAKRKLADLQD